MQVEFDLRELCVPIEWNLGVPLRSEAENLTIDQEKLLASLELTITRLVETILRTKLEEFMKDSIAEPPRSHFMILVAPWGYGKTHAARMLEKFAQEMGLGYRYVNFENVIEEVLEKIREMASRGSIRIEEIELLHEDILLNKLKPEDENKPLIVFIDEVEAFLEALRGRTETLRARVAENLLDALLTIAKHVMKPPKEVVPRYRELSGRVHIVVAATPEAAAAIREKAIKKGIAGRVHRRIDELRLPPLTKLDAEQLINTILQQYYKLPKDSYDPGLVTPFYLASGGSTGILIKLINDLISVSYSLCKEIYGKPCICKLQNPELLAILLQEITVTYTPVSEESVSLLNRDAINNLKEVIASPRWRSVSDTLMRLVLFLEPSEDLNYAVRDDIEAILSNMKLEKLDGINVAILEPQELRSIINNVVNKAKFEAGIDQETARAALETLIYPRGNKYLLLLLDDRRREHVTQFIFLTSLVNVNISDPSKAAKLLRLLRDEVTETPNAYIIDDALILAPSSYWKIYSPLIARFMPFAKSPEAAMKLYRTISELRSHDPERFKELLLKGVRLGLVWSGLAIERNGTFYLRVPVWSNVHYLVPLRFEYHYSYTPIHAYSDQLHPEVLFEVVHSASGAENAARRGILVVNIPASEALMIAAAALALEDAIYREFIDENKLQAYLRELIGLRVKTDDIKNLGEWLAENGIAVPFALPLDENLRDPDELLNAYRMLLLAGSKKLDITKLAETLFHLYRIRPYKHGRRSEWCEVRVPKVLMMDLEPNDHRDLYIEERVEKYLEKLRSILETYATTAMKIGLLTKEESGIYRFNLHPVEKRIIRILQRLREMSDKGVGSITIDELEKLFVYPEPSELKLHQQACKLLREFFIPLLEARGKIFREGNKLLLVSSVWGMSKQELGDAINEVQRFRNVAASGKIGLCTDIEDLEEIFTLTIFKEKGVKVIPITFLEDALKELMEAGIPWSLARDLRELVDGYAKFYTGILDGIKTLVEEVMMKIREARSRVYELVNLMKRLQPNLQVGHVLYVFSERMVCERLKDAMKESRELIRWLMRTSMKDIKKKHANLAVLFSYTNCDNKYRFSLAYYNIDTKLESLRKEIEELIFKIDKIIERMMKLKEEIERKGCSASEAPLEAPKTSLESLDDILRTSENYIQALEKLYSNCEKCIKAKEELRNEISNLSAMLTDLLNNIDNVEKNRIYLKELALEVRKLELHELISNEVINGIEKELRDIRKKFEEYLKAYEGIKKHAEGLTCSNLELLKIYTEEIKRICAEVYTLAKEVKFLRERVNELVSRFELSIENKIRELSKGLNHIKELAKRFVKGLGLEYAAKIATKIDELSRSLNEIRRMLQERRPMSLADKVTQARKLMQDLLNSLRDCITKMLGEDAFKVLLAYHELKSTIQQARFSELIRKLSQKTGLSKDTVLRVLLLLDEKEFIDIYTRL